MIRPKLGYAEVIWFPRKKKHVLKLERIQRIATKMVPEYGRPIICGKFKINAFKNIKRKKREREVS